LYEDFCSKKDSTLTVPSEKRHVFQALQYLKKLCNHPILVLNPSVPEFEKQMKQLKLKHAELANIQASSKLLALW
jgi:TATA-binding protein-associated factor